jgi:putative serine protease PepD
MSTPSFAHRRRDLGVPAGGTPNWLKVLAVAVLGGAVALALALAIGAVHTTVPATTVIESPPATANTRALSAGPWSAVYAQASPGTVDITVQMTATVATPFGARQQQEAALGSGFVLDGNGDIVTAAHVVDGANSISVAFQDGITRSGTVLVKDDASDVAVVRVNPAGLTLHPLSLGSSRTLAIGDTLAIIGDPLGFDRSLSTGVVSGLDRTIQAPNGFMIAHAIQTDAAMNPGSSGGPLFNTGGRVIGIADQIATGTNQFGNSSSETSSGVGFAIPIDLIKVELAALRRGQSVTHAYLGVGTVQTGRRGAVVGSVEPGTPAAKAGLRAGDVIVAIGGSTIRTEGDLIDALAAAHPGEQLKLTVLRGSGRVAVTVKLAAQPEQAPSQ